MTVPRNDPTDTGGLFLGRRPGTGPVRYRTPPERGDGRRRRIDALLAAAVLVAILAAIAFTAWLLVIEGPAPSIAPR